MIIYTDGSCSPNPGNGGWAFIALESDIITNYVSGYKLNTTNNIMELTAVIEALKRYSHVNEFTIHSDSMYVINCAKNIWKRNKNANIWKEFDEVSKGKSIEWVWVRGHSGDYYNEQVDRMAKNETDKCNVLSYRIN